MKREVSLVVSLVVAICGCARDAPPPPMPAARTDVSLSVLVVGEPELARGVSRLRGDWAELSGGSLTVKDVPLDEFSSNEPVSADVVIYPARYLGTLVAEERIRPLRASVREEVGLAFNEILPAIREGELAYGGEYYAVPFGSQVLVTVAGSGPTAPTAVGESDEATPRSAAAETASGEASNLPPDEFAAAHVLLALAAPKAKHPSQLAVLFDLETMQPQIAGPPFVEALEELVGATSAGTGEPASRQPAWQWWPPRDGAARFAAGQGVAAELPESGRVYYADGQTWERPSTGVSRAPLVGARSFIGSVTTASRNPPAAFRLLGWLAGRSERGGGRVSVVPYRRGTADELVERAFSQATYLQVPRVLEVDSYLAALDAGVRQAWQGELTPQDALGEAAKKWDEITDRIGRERQQKVYRDHLNLQ